MSPPPLPVVTPSDRTALPARSVFVTVLGWVVIVGSGLLVPVSVISLIMILVGSYGTAHTSWSGGLTIIGAPPATVVAGIGLLRRWRWAYVYTLALLAIVAIWNCGTLLRGSTPEHRYVSPGGVPTTVLASSVDTPFHLTVIVVTAALFTILLTRKVRAEFMPPRGLPDSGTTAQIPRI